MKKISSAQAIISVKAQRILLKDTYRRKHIEACGLLTGCIDEGENWHIELAHPLRNIFDSPVYFEFSPEDVLAIELDHPGQIIGAYHSHPTGLSIASSTDRQNMKRVNLEQQIPWVWVIISGPFNESFASFRQERPRTLHGWRRPDVRSPGNARKSTGREWLLHQVLRPLREIVLRMRKDDDETWTGTIQVSCPARAIHLQGCDVLQGYLGSRAIEAHL